MKDGILYHVSNLCKLEFVYGWSLKHDVKYNMPLSDLDTWKQKSLLSTLQLTNPL